MQLSTDTLQVLKNFAQINGNLTIEGEGTIDNVSHGRAAVYNELGASALLKGGTYTRSQENGSNNSKNRFFLRHK